MITTQIQSTEDTLEFSDNCTECGADSTVILDGRRGERTCSKCGLVIESGLIDQGQDWRAYNTEERNNRARAGEPLNPIFENYGLNSTIGSVSADSQGNPLSSARRFDFLRMSRLDMRSRTGEIRNLRVAFRELQRMISQLELGEGVSRASSLIYRRALKQDLVRGRSIETMIAASIYLACRETGTPQTLKDILASDSQLTAKDLGRCVRVLIRYLNLRSKPNDFSPMIYRLGESLRLPMEARAEAANILKIARGEGMTIGKNPMSLVAAALYIA
ncbi:MAG TPA: TFIIB-type zinc ribbon-containing protein, partial [Candidatus Hodarchaeales archaeon]|nr:TFIIB-type zinc ribbon-containing protein [Candidatus Hodarchaeales archaeon]